MTAIWDLFPGYEHAHGRYEVKSKNERGKSEGRAQTIREPVTRQLWEDHLSGKGAGLGVIPLMADNSVQWGCVDIDTYPLDHKALVASIEAKGLPLCVCRSKSGGAHLFLFTSEPVPAEAMQDLLHGWAAVLGYGGCEVFPKQIQRYNDQDLGNWLNMPFFGLPRTMRYGFDHNGDELLDPAAFSDFAESRRLPAYKFFALTGDHPTGDTKETHVAPVSSPYRGHLFEEGPPCLQLLEANGGFPEGTRNDGMYNVAVYLRKRFPDDWPDRMATYAQTMTDPPLGLSELNALVKSVQRKDYHYRCSKAPIAQHCNRKMCLSRQWGVGQGEGSADHVDIGSVTKYLGEPVLWFLDVNGQRLMVTTEELQSQTKFQAKMMEVLNRCITPMPPPRWAKYLDSKIRNCEQIEVPEDAGVTGQFRLLVAQYLTGMAQATSREELAHRLTPFRTGTGEVWFRSRGLLEYLNHHGFRYPSEHHVWHMLRAMGAESKFLNVKGRGFNVWCLPDPGQPEDDQDLPEFGTKEF